MFSETLRQSTGNQNCQPIWLDSNSCSLLITNPFLNWSVNHLVPPQKTLSSIWDAVETFFFFSTTLNNNLLHNSKTNCYIYIYFSVRQLIVTAPDDFMLHSVLYQSELNSFRLWTSCRPKAIWRSRQHLYLEYRKTLICLKGMKDCHLVHIHHFQTFLYTNPHKKKNPCICIVHVPSHSTVKYLTLCPKT